MKRCFILFVLIALLCLGACSSPDPVSTPVPTPEPEFYPGSIDGSSYTNDFLSIRFDLPENWVFASREEFSLLVGSGAQQLAADIKLDAPVSGSTFYEFYAYGSDGESVIMTVEDLSAHAGGKLLTVKDYMDKLASRYKELTSVSYSVGESYEHTIAQHGCYALSLSIEADGVFQRNCAFRSGNYMANITISAHSEDELDTLEAHLTKN